MYKLFMRAFPGWYSPNSVYALYPFTTPEKNQEVFIKNGRADTLDFKRPSFTKPPVPVTTWRGVVDLLSDQKNFHVPCKFLPAILYCSVFAGADAYFLELPGGEHTFQLIKHDYMLSGDTVANAEQRTFVAERLYRPSDTLDQVRQFYESITTDLIKRNSKKLGGSYQVDIVRE